MIEKRIQKQLVKNTFLFFLVFACVFALIGVFIYQTVSSNIFRSVDQQLKTVSVYSTSALFAHDGYGGIYPLFTDDFHFGAKPSDDSGSSSGPGQIIAEAVQSYPQMIIFLRNEQGILEETAGFYAVYPSVIQDTPFDPTNLNEIYTMEYDGSSYRAVNYAIGTISTTTNGSTSLSDAYYLQAILNVDSEIAILNQFIQTLTLALIGAVIFCAGASYVLSRKTIQPIAKAWHTQSEFIQNASHELRTPLTIIHTTQELMLERPHDTIMDHFEDINLTLEETVRLKHMADSLLTLTAEEPKVKPAEQSCFNLDEVIDETVLPYRDQAKMQEKVLECELTSGRTLQAERTKIEDLMAILLDNALKYTKAGDTIRISTEAKPGTTVIVVEDTGMGIDDKSIEHVFERFYRSDKARTVTKDGAGLGLSIAQDLAESLGGTIEMKHNQPSGVKLVVTLANKPSSKL